MYICMCNKKYFEEILLCSINTYLIVQYQAFYDFIKFAFAPEPDIFLCHQAAVVKLVRDELKQLTLAIGKSLKQLSLVHQRMTNNTNPGSKLKDWN